MDSRPVVFFALPLWARGVTWSSVALILCGNASDGSTLVPQIPHIPSSRAHTASKCFRCARCIAHTRRFCRAVRCCGKAFGLLAG